MSQFLNILADIRGTIGKDIKILDLGCGAGDVVAELRNRGYLAYGCDIHFKSGDNTQQLQEENIIRQIDLENYRIPFDDNYFDFVISDQVFEHVRNYWETIGEMSRVMTPNAACLHIFPSRYSVLEPHFKVPFGTIIQNRTWYEFWAWFGARRSSQKGKNPGEIARENIMWVREYTNYLPHDQILTLFREFFGNVFFAEKNFLKYANRGKYLYTILIVIPGLTLLYRYMKSNVLFAERKTQLDGK